VRLPHPPSPFQSTETESQLGLRCFARSIFAFLPFLSRNCHPAIRNERRRNTEIRSKLRHGSSLSELS
jgi:hypothetical protein